MPCRRRLRPLPTRPPTFPQKTALRPAARRPARPALAKRRETGTKLLLHSMPNRLVCAARQRVAAHKRAVLDVETLKALLASSKVRIVLKMKCPITDTTTIVVVEPGSKPVDKFVNHFKSYLEAAEFYGGKEILEKIQKGLQTNDATRKAALVTRAEVAAAKVKHARKVAEALEAEFEAELAAAGPGVPTFASLVAKAETAPPAPQPLAPSPAALPPAPPPAVIHSVPALAKAAPKAVPAGAKVAHAPRLGGGGAAAAAAATHSPRQGGAAAAAAQPAPGVPAAEVSPLPSAKRPRDGGREYPAEWPKPEHSKTNCGRLFFGGCGKLIGFRSKSCPFCHKNQTMPYS